MKITQKLLHIPPYLTTTWSHIKALHMNSKTLAVILTDGRQIDVPDLSEEILNTIFTSYSTYLESDKNPPTTLPQHQPTRDNHFLVHTETSLAGQHKAFGKFNFNTIDPSGMAMEHNPLEANTPEFPREVLEKISAIARIVAPDDVVNMPGPIANCNCPHCQITRAIQEGTNTIQAAVHPEHMELVPQEEIVEAKDLDFQQWSIVQTGDNLYDVTNKLDPHETYHVFLGEPVGCTCGQAGCEHILSVLKS